MIPATILNVQIKSKCSPGLQTHCASWSQWSHRPRQQPSWWRPPLSYSSSCSTACSQPERCTAPGGYLPAHSSGRVCKCTCLGNQTLARQKTCNGDHPRHGRRPYQRVDISGHRSPLCTSRGVHTWTPCKEPVEKNVLKWKFVLAHWYLLTFYIKNMCSMYMLQ